jgi:hypothetical protein
MRRRKLFWILSFILGLIILFLILLPGIAKQYIVRHSKEYINRQIAIDKLRLNYFTSTIRINGFKMYEADGKEVFVSFDNMLVNFQPINLLQNELVIEKFELAGLYANIIQRDSSFNFEDIIDFLNKPSDSAEIETDTTPSTPMHFRFYDLSLRQAHIIYDDRNVNKATHLRDFSLHVPFIAWNQEDKSEAGLRFNFAQEGYFESSLRIDPAQGDFLANVTIERLHLDAFKEYISYYTNIQSLNGIFNCHINLAGNINNIEESVVSGKIKIQDLSVTDSLGAKLLGTDQINIGMKKIDYAHSRYEFDSLILTGPYVHFILSDSANNISALFNMPDDTAATVEALPETSTAATSDSLYYSIDNFMIKEGVVDYTDNLTGEPFNYHLSDIGLNAGSITTDADWVDLYAQMVLNERGTLKADIGFNPDDPVNNVKLDYVVTNFRLSDLNIYSRFYMGFPILLGDMYYKSSTSIIQGQLNSSNKLVMTDVELGNKGGGIYDVPIKLALFILRDRYGVINLDVPVRGDLNDPTIKIGRIIWNTFKNLIVKIATKPFDILAQSIGADPRDLESIEFEYLDTTLTPQKQRQLELLLNLEDQKPGLQIDMIYYNDINKEKELIAVENYNTWDEAALQVQADIMARSRIRLLEDHLMAVNDSTTINITSSNPDDPKNIGSKPVFQIIYFNERRH